MRLAATRLKKSKLDFTIAVIRAPQAFRRRAIINVPVESTRSRREFVLDAICKLERERDTVRLDLVQGVARRGRVAVGAVMLLPP